MKQAARDIEKKSPNIDREITTKTANNPNVVTNPDGQVTVKMPRGTKATGALPVLETEHMLDTKTIAKGKQIVYTPLDEVTSLYIQGYRYWHYPIRSISGLFYSR